MRCVWRVREEGEGEAGGGWAKIGGWWVDGRFKGVSGRVGGRK